MGKRKGKKHGGRKSEVDIDKDIEEYDVSQSEDEFGRDEKILLDNRRGKKHQDSEEEVFGIHSSSDEEEDDQFYGGGVGSDLDSDIEGKGSDKDSEAGLPDSKAWGKKLGRYYNTDYVDKDFGGMSKEDEELAEMEEEEAANIQKRLMSHMLETDFTLGLLDKVEEKKTELSKRKDDVVDSEKITSDLSRMSKSEKIQLLKQESPELFQLIDEFKDNMTLVRDKLLPIKNLVESGKISTCPASEFVDTLVSVIINYSTNIIFYLFLKSKHRGAIDSHPIVQRLYTYKKVTDEMLLVMEDRLSNQMDEILETEAKGAKLEQVALEETKTAAPKNRAERRKRQFKILEELKSVEKRVEKKKAKLSSREGDEAAAVSSESEHDDQPHVQDSEEEERSDLEESEESKRGITYEMKKNKGLTPRRKKEDRNPRVKHRNKYRKAKIRRKGQVREARTEVTKYGGELSGIKAYVSKSVKIKT